MFRLNNIPWAPNQCCNQAEGCMPERGHPIEVSVWPQIIAQWVTRCRQLIDAYSSLTAIVTVALFCLFRMLAFFLRVQYESVKI